MVSNVPVFWSLMNALYDALTVAGVTLFEPTRQSFESYSHMIVCRPSAWAIARMRSYTRIKDITVFRRETGNQEAYINVSIGRTPAGRGDTRDGLDSLHLERKKRIRDDVAPSRTLTGRLRSTTILQKRLGSRMQSLPRDISNRRHKWQPKTRKSHYSDVTKCLTVTHQQQPFLKLT